MFSISICTARYGRYVSVCHIIGTLTARYRAVPLKSTIGGRFQPSAVDFSHRQSIEGEKGKKKKKKRKRRKKKEERRKKRRRRKYTSRRRRPRVVRALRRRPRPLLRFFSRAGRKIEVTIPLSTDGMYWSDKEPVWVVHYPHVHMSLKSLDVSRGFDGVPVFQFMFISLVTFCNFFVQSDLLVVKKKNKRYCPIYFQKVGSLEDVLKKMEVRKLFVEHTNIKLLQNLILLQTDYRLMTRILGGMI
ncbi:hypothetical protein GW17_00037512 [Ensete ventricosum]|nr:hypothetical protein GW17_00037512 [Ensete ventricosum]